ncbi:unnamed protein product [Mytilus coruscus]|uniref:DZIP3-like HEPN domain-containing protein n=1 Tax=Mytilus coruscus TaxID=42192 RepID=A0A6J8BE55_MYTCO|nr:unnamed protein product [Mytilus coruscus]
MKNSVELAWQECPKKNLKNIWFPFENITESMDREDRHRYFIKRIEIDYTSCGLASLQDFLNKQSTIHVLFHLRHRNTWCCKDKTKCSNNRSLPLQYCQWDLLYTETNPGVNPHDCHCKFSANPVQLGDLDITLASLILLNCCNLTPDEKAAIKKLRQYKNDYLSHNIKGAITKREYRTLWADLTNFILQLDPSKQDNLTRIEARPLDEALCSRYCISLLDLHERLDEICSTIQTMNNSVQGSIQNIGTTVQSSLQNMESSMQVIGNSVQGSLQNMGSSMQVIGNSVQSSLQNMESSMQVIGNSVQGSLQNMGTSMQGTLRNIDTSLQELLFYARRGMACQCYAERIDNQEKRLPFRRKYQLGQSIFTLHNQIDLASVINNALTSSIPNFLTSVAGDDWRGDVTDKVMMDDGRLVICLPYQCRLLICNTDGSQVDSIDVQVRPLDVTAVNNSTVAVTLLFSKCIEMYDINNKQKLKSISVPRMRWCFSDITTINNKLVVGVDYKLQIIDHQTGEVVQTIKTDCVPHWLHGSDDRIFYYNPFNNKLYWYSYTDGSHHTLTLPSPPRRMTTLQDGSMYVICCDGSVQHVSSDGTKYKTVKTKGIKSIHNDCSLYYNCKQRKLVTCYSLPYINIFHEK